MRVKSSARLCIVKFSVTPCGGVRTHQQARQEIVACADDSDIQLAAETPRS